MGTIINVYMNTESTHTSVRSYIASGMALPLFLLGFVAHNVRRDFLYFCWHVWSHSCMIIFVFTGRVRLNSLWY